MSEKTKPVVTISHNANAWLLFLYVYQKCNTWHLATLFSNPNEAVQKRFDSDNINDDNDYNLSRDM